MTVLRVLRLPGWQRIAGIVLLGVAVSSGFSRAGATVFERVSVGSGGVQAMGASWSARLSGDGKLVAFLSNDAGLDPTPGGAPYVNIYIRNRATNVTQRVVIRGIDGNEPNATIYAFDISSDFEWIAFASPASNLVSGDANGKLDVFLLRRFDGLLRRISVPVTPHWSPEGDADSGGKLAISAGGHVVAFTSLAGNLTWEDVDGDGSGDAGVDINGDFDVFVYDQSKDRLFLASVGSGGRAAGGTSVLAGLSGNGRFLSFESHAAGIVAGDDDYDLDLFVLDRGTNAIERITVGPGTMEPVYPEGGAMVGGGALSFDGRFVVYGSNAQNLVAGDTNDAIDIFVYDRRDRVIERASVGSGGGEGESDSGGGIISANGRFVLFTSRAKAFAPGETYGDWNVFARDRQAGMTWRVSRNAAGGPVFADSYAEALSGDGWIAVMVSHASDLVAGDTNGVQDLFLASSPLRISAAQAVVNRNAPAGSGANLALVAEKDLAVRAYVRLPVDRGPTAANAWLCVDEPVDNCPPNRLFLASGTVHPIGTEFSEDQLRQAHDSLNFYITGSAGRARLVAGSHTFNVRVAPASGAAFATVDLRLVAECRESRSLRVLLHPIRVPTTAGGSAQPDGAQVSRATDFLRAVYPVSPERVNPRVASPLLVAELPPATAGEREALQRALALRLARLELSFRMLERATPDYRFSAGIVPNLVDGVNPIGAPDMAGLRGYTYADLPGIVVTLDKVAAPPPGDAAVAAKTLAHEIGHQLGLGEEYCLQDRNGAPLTFPCPADSLGAGTLPFFSSNNPPPQNGAEGSDRGNYVVPRMDAFDAGGLVAGRRAVFGPPGSAVFGFMGNMLETESWTTQIEYEYLYLRTTDPPGSRARPQRVAPRAVVVVSGTISKNRAATIDPLLAVTSDAEVPAPVGTGYVIELRSGSGRRKAGATFGLSFTKELLADEAQVVDLTSTPFGLVVELPPDVSSMHLSDGQGELAVVTRSPNPPALSVSPIAVTSTAVEASWQGADADGDSLLFAVFYSPDGAEVLPVAVDLDATELTLPFSEVGIPRDGAFLQVIASDGFNATEVQQSVPAVAVPVAGPLLLLALLGCIGTGLSIGMRRSPRSRC